MVEGRVEFRLLGPLEVVAEGHQLSLGGSRPRALLALLLLHGNEVVSVDRIIDELWDAQPPRTAEQAVRVYVWNLRKALEAERSDAPPQVLVTHDNGYLLKVALGDVDVDCFEALRAEGRRLLASGDAVDAAKAFDSALALWRGSPLQDFTYERFARSEILRLEELRMTTLEDRFDAQLASGMASELVADLAQLVDAQPLRERLRGQLMLALYRSGRQADALEAYQKGRQLLVDELGLEPGGPLQQLETLILQQDPLLEPTAVTPAAVIRPQQTPSRTSRQRVRAGALALVTLALATATLVAATGWHDHAPSVAFVIGAPRSAIANPAQGFLINEVEGMQYGAKAAGVPATVLFSGDSYTGFMQEIARAARRNNLVIVGATPDLEQLSELTRRFPGTRFLVPDSVTDPEASFAGQRNVTGINFHDRENAYLGGYLAGLMTHGHEAVSAVGGFPTESVRDLIAGFTAGAHRARGGIRVLVNYTDSFDDGALCASAANGQIDRGSDVVFDVAGACGVGALQAAGIRGVWGLGVDSNMSYLGPQVLASVVKQFGLATALAVKLFAAGRLPRGRDIQVDLASGNIGLIGISHEVPTTVRAKVEAVQSMLLARDQTYGSR
jgi:DNA-binding SARP family transcriptional activator/basic membrane lipoprotein Med (substrate-binding protein (PBP1-ABC) superfamily)